MKIEKILIQGLDREITFIIGKNKSENLRNIECFIKLINPIILNETDVFFDSVAYQEAVNHFLINGTGFNKLREKKVPDIVYHTYFKKLREKGGPPTIENTPGKVFYVY